MVASDVVHDRRQSLSLALVAHLLWWPYVLRRDNLLTLASMFSILCTLFFAAILLGRVRGGEDAVVVLGKWILLVVNGCTMFVHLLAVFWELALAPLTRFLGGPGARTRAGSLNTGIDGGADPLPNVRPESAIFDTSPAPKFTSKSFDD